MHICRVYVNIDGLAITTRPYSDDLVLGAFASWAVLFKNDPKPRYYFAAYFLRAVLRSARLGDVLFLDEYTAAAALSRRLCVSLNLGYVLGGDWPILGGIGRITRLWVVYIVREWPLSSWRGKVTWFIVALVHS